MKKWLTIVSLALIVIIFGYGYFRYYFVWGEGVKSGQLNYVVHKGYIFKTYEGKMIQAGIKASPTNSIQSNEFIFSVSDKRLAEALMMAGGKDVDVHYKEYLSPIPWRGYSKYVVDSIIEIK
ncbi:MAG: hypothetical protein LBD45_09345 [Bacteroidales bacterium]|nr:hypothetical protein [Bacteroidales bacterium]